MRLGHPFQKLVETPRMYDAVQFVVGVDVCESASVRTCVDSPGGAFSMSELERVASSVRFQTRQSTSQSISTRPSWPACRRSGHT